MHQRSERNVPDSVRWAQYTEDKATLSFLGRLGNKIKKERNDRKKIQLERAKTEKLQRDLESAQELAIEANEHICPVGED